MKTERGAENIRRFNSEREARYIPLIKEELKKCKRMKLQFKSLGGLAEYLSGVTSIHRTTLSRNPRYKSLLAKHLGEQTCSGAAVGDSDAAPEILQARLLGARLEISNLQEKVRRLESFVRRNGELPALDAIKGAEKVSVGNNDYLAFVDTAMALTAVLERLRDSMSVDFSKRTIEDLAARPSERVVVGPERATPYLDWLQQQSALLLGK